jgi:hypothetical protein
MRHYNEAEWVDYVRGLGSPSWRAGVAAHLRSGCDTCCAAHSAIVKIAGAVVGQWALTPPDTVLRRAQAIFTEFRPDHVCDLPALPARLVHDSVRQAVPAGVRGSEGDARRGLFHAGESVIDLRFERRPGLNGIVLIGQWMAAGRPYGPAPRRPVVLTAGRRVVTATVTNDHGEFQLEYQPVGQMRLHIGAPDGDHRIEVPLAHLHRDLRS